MCSAESPTVHATAVVIGAAGVLIRGRPGAGKSTLALDLVERRTAAGSFAALIADDRVHLSAAGGRLIARRPGRIAGLIEVRGVGILPVPSEAAAVIRLVIDLEPAESVARLPEAADDRVILEGISLRRLVLGCRDTRLASATVERVLAARNRSAESSPSAGVNATCLLRSGLDW